MTFAFAPAQRANTAAQHQPGLSLQWRVLALVTGMLLLLACAAVGLQAWTLAQGLRAEQAVRNAEAAQTLAAAWSRPRGDATSLRALAESRFALGREDGIRLHAAQGLAPVSLSRVPGESAAPAWFVRAWPLAVPAGRSAVAVAGNPLAAQESARGATAETVLEVESSLDWTYQLLWQTVSRSAALLALFAAAASLLTAAVLRGWLQPWQLTLDQLQALSVGRLTPMDESGPPEMRKLARSMNATVRDLRQDLAEQTEQVLRLQRQAQTDTLTGVALRHHFLGQLQRRLADPQRGCAAVLIVRVCDLEALNLRAGREATDRLLCAVAQVLLTYVDRVPGTLAGRLNGGDFALCLPVGGVAQETALSLREALGALPVLRSAGAQAVVGGVDDLTHTSCSLALAEADAALARAEAGEAGGAAVDGHGDLVADAAGASAWHLQIAEALTQERGRLETTPVLDREGRTLHGACTLHLQLVAGAAHQPPRSWLALARRAQLLPRVDLLTVQLALHAIAADRQARCVRVAAAAWSTPGYVAAVQALLQAAPTQARALSIELVAPETVDASVGPLAALAAWAPTGVRLGLAHGAEMPKNLGALQAAGMAFVTLASAHLRGVATDPALQAYAQGLLQLLHELDLRVLLDGAADPHDLDRLWSWGLDGAAAPLPGV